MSDVPSYGFYTNDLQIEYIKYDFPRNKTSGYTHSKIGFYQILYIKSGSFKVEVNSIVNEVNDGCIVISNKSGNLKYHRTTENAESITIYFLESAIKDVNRDDFLRAFNNTPPGTAFNLRTMENLICLETLNSFINSIFEKREKIYMLIKLKSIIAELGFAFDKTSNNETYDKKNTALSVVEYVKIHYAENITLSLLRDKFFISNSSINRIFKTLTGRTFTEFLCNIRLKNAHELINTKTVLSVKEIAQINGFSTYSTFYRAYIKKYGIPPSTNQHKYDKNWPISK